MKKRFAASAMILAMSAATVLSPLTAFAEAEEQELNIAIFQGGYGDAYWNAQLNNVPITMPDGEKVLTMKWDSRMSLRPIPQTAIDLNPLLATDQNPGY